MAHNASPPGVDKAGLRRDMLARRRALTPEQSRLAGQAVRERLAAFEPLRAAREVLVYLAFGGEVETRDLVADLLERGVRVLAPRCRPGQAGQLDLACLTCLEELVPGAYGIPEPDPERCPALGPEAADAAPGAAPDVALIPAVAFDRRGARLGFGQGYYDRLLAGPGFRDTLLVGLAHPFQLVDFLPQDPWDRPVHAVVTPQELLWTSR
uniref:5-formyltetrahydrofolate cyclo-ligase n=1 Tax=Fundidesulfovibrio putealis TaxID=270496 RepID=A0A7C4EM61_9BACT